MTNTDNQAARAAANYAHECMFHFHRGTLDCEDKVIVFGNDGYEGSEKCQKQVQLLQDWLIERGLTRSEFAPSDNGYSWAIVVFNYDRQPIYHDVNDKLQECWRQVISMETDQLVG